MTLHVSKRSLPHDIIKKIAKVCHFLKEFQSVFTLTVGHRNHMIEKTDYIINY